MFYIVRDDLNIFYKPNSAAPGNLIFCKSAWVANMDMHHTRSVFSLGIMLPSQYTGTCVGSGGVVFATQKIRAALSIVF